jgi:hypothetical protein
MGTPELPLWKIAVSSGKCQAMPYFLFPVKLALALYGFVVLSKIHPHDLSAD